MANEVANAEYTVQSEVYSFGVVLLEVRFDFGVVLPACHRHIHLLPTTGYIVKLYTTKHACTYWYCMNHALSIFYHSAFGSSHTYLTTHTQLFMGQRVALRTATDVVEAAEDDGQSSLVAIAESGTWTGGSAEELAALILDCLHPRQKKRPHGMVEVADRLLVVSLDSVPRFYVCEALFWCIPSSQSHHALNPRLWLRPARCGTWWRRSRPRHASSAGRRSLDPFRAPVSPRRRTSCVVDASR
jgi:hypothetical protein